MHLFTFNEGIRLSLNMVHSATTSSFHPIVDVHTFNRLCHTYSEPTYSRQNYPPPVPYYYLEYVCQLLCKQQLT
jgi:hypothetical protein